MPNKTNRLLDALPEDTRGAVTSRLVRKALHQHQVLFDVRALVSEVHFPLDAVISLVIPFFSGGSVESAMTGRDGVVGAGAALYGRVSLNRAIVQIGGYSLSCGVDDFKRIIDEHPPVRSVIGAHEQALFAQAQQSAACNASHSLQSRLARWLLRVADLHGGSSLELTQESLAEMLGARRTSVTVIAHTLQQAGMISYRRGRVQLTDIQALQKTACECHEAIKMNYDAIFHVSNA